MATVELVVGLPSCMEDNDIGTVEGIENRDAEVVDEVIAEDDGAKTDLEIDVMNDEVDAVNEGTDNDDRVSDELNIEDDGAATGTKKADAGGDNFSAGWLLLVGTLNCRTFVDGPVDVETATEGGSCKSRFLLESNSE
ncbi:hypothetical protein SLE2022_358550 [Rubroshorea leprosula]